MVALVRCLSALLIACCVLACSEDLTSEDHLKAAKLHVEQGANNSAIIELKNALQLDVNNSRARSLLGKLYFETGDYEDADKELTLALTSGVDTTVIVPDLAQVLLELGAFERLDTLALDGLDPESRSTVLAAKGLSMIYRGNMSTATENMAAALNNEPVSPFALVAAARLAMEQDDIDSARAQLQGILKSSPKYAPAWSLLGDIESMERRPKEAEAAYSKVIQLTGNSFDATLNRAMMRIYLGNFKGARQDLQKVGRAFRHSKYHPGVYFAWGLLHLQAKQIDRAAKSFQSASDFSEDYPQTLYYLAAIYVEKGLSEQALSTAYRFLGLVPDSVAGAKLAAKLELGQGRYQKAETLLSDVVAANPDDVEALNLLASAYLAQGKSGEGVALLAKVSELEPKSQVAKARLGAGLLAAGSEELGIQTLKKILEKDPEFEQADILIVLNYLRQDKVDEAIKAANKFKSRNPESATSYNLLGRAYLAKGAKEKATKAFTKAFELSPGDPGAGLSLADMALAEENYDLARQYYNEILQHNSGHMPTRMKFAASLALEGREADMLDYLQSTLKDYPRAMEPRLVKARYAIANGEPEKALPLLEELSEEQKQHPDAVVTLASMELATARYNQAVVTLGKLIEQFPDVSQYRYMRAKAYAGLGDMGDFREDLERTVEMDPNHFYAKIALTRLALLSNQSESFEANLVELKEMAPDNPDVMKLAVVSAQRSGDNEQALQLLETILEREPSSANVIALASHRQAGGDTEAAIVQLQQWLQTHKDDIPVRSRLAEVYGSNNQVGGVVYQYEKILNIEPDNVIALNNLAWYLLDDDPEKALGYAERAIDLSPDSSSVLDTLALAQLRNGNVAGARRSIDRALEIAPQSPDIRFHHAQVSAEEGKTQTAIKALNDLLLEHPDFSERTRLEVLLEHLQTQP